MWFRNVFVPQLNKTVVSRYEEIVAGNVRPFVIRRPLAGSLNGERVSGLLHRRFQRPPRLQRPGMDGSLLQLRRSPRELSISFLLVVRDALPMVISTVPHGTIAVVKRDGRIKTLHRSKFRLGFLLLRYSKISGQSSRYPLPGPMRNNPPALRETKKNHTL